MCDLVGVLGQQRLRQRPAGDDPVPAGVRLERPHGGRPPRRRRDAGPEARHLMLKNRSAPMSAPKPGLGDEEVAAVDADQVGDDRGVAVGDVAERAGVHQDRRVLQRLQQVGLHRVAQDRRHRAGAADVLGRHRLAVPGVADDDAPEPLPQVGQRGGQREDRHHLGGGGDVEAGLAGHAVLRPPRPMTMLRSARSLTSSTRRQVMSCGSRPSVVALVEVVVDHRRQQVVRRGDGVEVAGQVQVERLHRHDLAVAAAGRAALDAERRAHRRLPDRDGRAAADVPEAPGRGRPSSSSCPRRAASA